VRDVELVQAALGLVWPWRVESVAFYEKARRLDLALNYERGGTFARARNAAVMARCVRWGWTRRRAGGATTTSRCSPKGAAEQFTEAEITFDKFHVLRLLNAAGDEVRRGDRRSARS
jgi:hypothetical protein